MDEQFIKAIRDIWEGQQIVLECLASEEFKELMQDYLRYTLVKATNYEEVLKNVPVNVWVKAQELHWTAYSFGANLRALDRLADWLPQLEGKTLDVGCNDGGLVKELHSRGYDCYGVDLPEVINKAREKHPDIADRLSVCNLETDELRDGPYDLVLVLGVMDLLKNYDLLFGKISRALKPNGKLYLSTSNRKYRTLDLYSAHYFTEEELTEMANKAGLEPLAYKTIDSKTNLTGVFRK